MATKKVTNKVTNKVTKKIDVNELLDIGIEHIERVKSLVDLWYETQLGCMHKCLRKQHEFHDVMWKLHEEFHPED